MGIKTAYKGYSSYSYLEPGRDYPVFELPAWNWAGENRIRLDEEGERRMLRLARESIVVAVHDHPNYFPKEIEETIAYSRAGRYFTAYDGLSVSFLDCVFDNLMDGICNISSPNGWKWTEVIHDLGMRLCDLAHQDFLVPCKRVEDIYSAHTAGKIAWVPVLEGAAPIENEVDRIDILYGLGIRQMGITYSESNALGSGMKEPRDGGLTTFGRRCVRRMNQVGMLLDISHCGVRTAMEAVEASDMPVIASHTGARSLWDIRRLFPDELIKAVAEKGGVIGVEAAPHTTMSKTNNTHDVYSTMEHFEYIADLVGIDHVAFGPDTAYGDHVGLHNLFAKLLSTAAITGAGASGRHDVPFVSGMENPTEASWNILRYLVKQNYSDEDIHKIVGGNALRVLAQVWK